MAIMANPINENFEGVFRSGSEYARKQKATIKAQRKREHVESKVERLAHKAARAQRKADAAGGTEAGAIVESVGMLARAVDIHPEKAARLVTQLHSRARKEELAELAGAYLAELPAGAATVIVDGTNILQGRHHGKAWAQQPAALLEQLAGFRDRRGRDFADGWRIVLVLPPSRQANRLRAPAGAGVRLVVGGAQALAAEVACKRGGGRGSCVVVTSDKIESLGSWMQGAAVMRSNAFLTLVARAAAEVAGGAHPGQPGKAKHMRGGRGPQCSRVEGRSRRAARFDKYAGMAAEA